LAVGKDIWVKKMGEVGVARDRNFACQGRMAIFTGKEDVVERKNSGAEERDCGEKKNDAQGSGGGGGWGAQLNGRELITQGESVGRARGSYFGRGSALGRQGLRRWW